MKPKPRVGTSSFVIPLPTSQRFLPAKQPELHIE
nr:MAG TPA: hypothetical protein [Caudoviricetes sp.]